MKQVAVIILIFLFVASNGFAQQEQNKHFDIDIMVGMHSYSHSFFHATNSVVWIQNPASNMEEFSGYGNSILPAINVSYFFNNSLGITAGFVAISAENDLYVDDEAGTNYDYALDQYNLSLGVTGRYNFDDSPVSILVGSGLIAAPFDISESITTHTGGSYLSGNNGGIGYYGSAGFQLKIISFLNFKSEFQYSFIPAEITLKDDEGNIEQNIKNLNVGGITLKTGLAFVF